MRYSYPSDFSANGNWEGYPSIGRGIIERCAHLQRRESGEIYAKLLYIGAGHRRGPWGALAIEVNGHTYQFGAGIARFPHLINEDRTLSVSGERLIATGLAGQVSVDKLEWHWLHDSCDLHCMLNDRQIGELGAHWIALSTGETLTPIFQSWPYTDIYDVRSRSDGMNCTRIQAKMLGEIVSDASLDDDRPLRFFKEIQRREFSFALMCPEESNISHLDEIRRRWAVISDERLKMMLPEFHDEELRLIVKSRVPVPKPLLDWYIRGPE